MSAGNVRSPLGRGRLACGWLQSGAVKMARLKLEREQYERVYREAFMIAAKILAEKELALPDQEHDFGVLGGEAACFADSMVAEFITGFSESWIF